MARGKQEYVLINIVEEIVKKKVREAMATDDMCQCDKCFSDVCCIILNNLKPRYVTTEKGYLLTLLAEEELQFKADLTAGIIKAIKLVREKPMH